MRKVLKSWDVRLYALVVTAIVLYGTTAYGLLPRTADGVSVTVLRCATVQYAPVDDCPGTTIFHRTFTDEAVVSGVRATLDQLHDQFKNFFSYQASNWWSQTGVYRIDLLWHGVVVKSNVAPYPVVWWDISTLGDVGGVFVQWAPDGLTTWQDLVRLTGMPLAPNGEP